jgi:transposase
LHTAVAVDELGRRLAERTVRATPAGHLELLAWAERWIERRWALEDCRHRSRRLEADLVRAAARA